jgi:5-formyltetrahydrofolate cyclo-ligase
VTSPRDPKAELRRALRRSRPDAESQAGQSAAIRQRLRAWLEPHPARTLATFAALPGEPRLLELLAELPDRRWALPRVVGDRLDFHLATPVDLVAGAFGILEPSPAAPLCPPEEIELFLCPGMAFTDSGSRLGRGMGYYDRALAAAPAAIRVGVGFREQVVSELPLETHDQSMQFLATPDAVRACR